MGSEPPTTRPATADVLIELRAKVVKAKTNCMDRFMDSMSKYGFTEDSRDFQTELFTFNKVMQWIDELAPTTTPQEPPC